MEMIGLQGAALSKQAPPTAASQTSQTPSHQAVNIPTRQAELDGDVGDASMAESEKGGEKPDKNTNLSPAAASSTVSRTELGGLMAVGEAKFDAEDANDPLLGRPTEGRFPIPATVYGDDQAATHADGIRHPDSAYSDSGMGRNFNGADVDKGEDDEAPVRLGVTDGSLSLTDGGDEFTSPHSMPGSDPFRTQRATAGAGDSVISTVTMTASMSTMGLDGPTLEYSLKNTRVKYPADKPVNILPRLLDLDPAIFTSPTVPDTRALKYAGAYFSTQVNIVSPGKGKMLVHDVDGTSYYLDTSERKESVLDDRIGSPSFSHFDSRKFKRNFLKPPPEIIPPSAPVAVGGDGVSLTGGHSPRRTPRTPDDITKMYAVPSKSDRQSLLQRYGIDETKSSDWAKIFGHSRHPTAAAVVEKLQLNRQG